MDGGCHKNWNYNVITSVIIHRTSLSNYARQSHLINVVETNIRQ
jgi:hypothetical protein